MKGIVITSNFPSRRNPGRGAFVSQAVKDFISDNIEITVVAPMSYANLVRDFKNSHSHQLTDPCAVIRPSFPTFSNKNILGVSLRKLSRKSFLWAVNRSLTEHRNIDFFYGKFLFSGGAAAVELGEKYKLPSFIDLGESTLLENLTEADKLIASSIIRKATGVICVSDRLRNEAIQLGANPEKVVTVSNRADPMIFRPMDRLSCRKILGLDEAVKLIIFIGYFIDRKGVKYVEKCIKDLNSEEYNVKGIFIGSGPLEPSSEVCAFKGRVAHDKLPIWLNSADVFCLPTKAEGNCNAINEAMSVGLVTVTSDIPDVSDQVSEYKPKALVNPDSFESIKQGLKAGLLMSENLKKENPGPPNEIITRGKEIAGLIRKMLASSE